MIEDSFIKTGIKTLDRGEETGMYTASLIEADTMLQAMRKHYSPRKVKCGVIPAPRDNGTGFEYLVNYYFED